MPKKRQGSTGGIEDETPTLPWAAPIDQTAPTQRLSRGTLSGVSRYRGQYQANRPSTGLSRIVATRRAPAADTALVAHTQQVVATSAYWNRAQWQTLNRSRLAPSRPDIDQNLSRRQYLAIAIGTTGAGAAAGNAASGTIDGSSNTTIDQAVIIREVETYASGGGLSLIDTDNTGFTFGVDVAQGEQYVLHLLIDNRSDDQTKQRFSLDQMPDPLAVNLFGDPPTGVAVSQVAHKEWLVDVEPEYPSASTSVPDNEQIIEVLVDVANTAAPKTYELSGTLKPTSV